MLNAVVDPEAEDDDGVSILVLLEPLQDLRGEHVELEFLVDLDILSWPFLLDISDSIPEIGSILLSDQKRDVEKLSKLAAYSTSVDNHRHIEGSWGVPILNIAQEEDSLLWINLSNFFE